MLESVNYVVLTRLSSFLMAADKEKTQEQKLGHIFISNLCGNENVIKLPIIVSLLLKLHCFIKVYYNFI